MIYIAYQCKLLNKIRIKSRFTLMLFLLIEYVGNIYVNVRGRFYTVL
jgi:hypothetical protein